MDNKQGLINDLLNNGKGDRNWLDIAKQYEIGEGLTNEQRSKKANDIYRAYLKKENKNLEDFEKNSKVKRVSKWQNSQGKWLQSIAYEANTQDKFDSEKFKADLIKSISEYELPKFEKTHLNYNSLCAVINLYDAHISSLCSKNETGVDSDTDSSIVKFEKCFDELLTTTEAFIPEVIIFPIGNDFLHENSASNTTKKGTKLDVSGNHFDNFTKGLSLLRKCIDKCSQVSRVYVPLIAGNHDTDSTNYLATALEEIFKDNSNVEIDARRITRKYFKYGKNLIGLTHGDNIKMDQLPLIMAVEQPQHFADTSERIWLTGHVHHLQTKEFPGVSVRSLRGLADTDKWHFDNGFIGSKKQGSVMLFQHDEGLKSEFTCNIK
jgi:formylmethanofuran dehydrogenase subunit D